ncbi:hypothetical protein Moror_4548 [Moniliophthora roreri MCA 2997]|uniref:Uncharacterized protein n=1 Tax=Moniliophthora roreri (strain MCA 2997) TaxID=1381753 RepID=V2XFB5_MONRO|nr:hypothetical protein Moror_4548 [Moniliophthora roreri MCA 2997]
MPSTVTAQPYDASDPDLDFMLKKLGEASRQNNNVHLMDISRLALDLHELRKIPLLVELPRACCDAAYAVISAHQSLLQSSEKPASPSLQEKLEIVQSKLYEINDFARTVATRNFLASLFSYKWDAAKVQEYRMEMTRYVCDPDFEPKFAAESPTEPPISINKKLKRVSLQVNTRLNRGDSRQNCQSSPFVSTPKLKIPALLIPKTSNTPIIPTSPGLQSPFGRYSNTSTPTLATPTRLSTFQFYLGTMNSRSEVNVTKGCGNSATNYNYQSFNSTSMQMMSQEGAEDESCQSR